MNVAPSLRQFGQLENFYVLKVSLTAKYVPLEVNEQKHNVLRRKFRSIKIYGLKNPAALQKKTDFLGTKLGKALYPNLIFVDIMKSRRAEFTLKCVQGLCLPSSEIAYSALSL